MVDELTPEQKAQAILDARNTVGLIRPIKF